MKYIILLAVATVICSSCKKNAENFNSFFDCSSQQHLDSVAITQKLVGTWAWSKFLCGDGAGKITTADKIVKAIFNTNGTFTIIENLSITAQGTWHISITDGSNYGVVLTQSASYFYGRILFCDDSVLFNDSYVDGCDNLFIKSR